ncbi:hypothetical protein D3C72_713430 [compost metagenome]
MNGQAITVLKLHGDVEGRGSLALQDALLGAAPARLLVREGHRLDAADEVREGGVHQEVLERVAVGRPDELDPALGDGPGREGLLLGADLVDDDDFRHVVLDRLDHHAFLRLGGGHLHAAGPADGGVRDVAVAGDLVGRVDDDHALAELVGQHAGDLAELGGLADAGATHHQDRAAGFHQVADDVDGAQNGAAHAAGQADDAALAVADGRDAVERALDAGAVVAGERADAGHDQVDVLHGDRLLAQVDHPAGEAGLRLAAQVHDDLDQLLEAILLAQGGRHVRRNDVQKLLQIVRDTFFM